MQTFLPWPDFEKSAQSLDYRRLGKQRVEAWSILHLVGDPMLGHDFDGAYGRCRHCDVAWRTAVGSPPTPMTWCRSKPWNNHPAAVMWRGAELALAFYGMTMCHEWVRRGYRDSLYDKFLDILVSRVNQLAMPSWLGDEAFHRSHRANLVRKDPAHYAPQFGQLEWEPYVWPTNMKEDACCTL